MALQKPFGCTGCVLQDKGTGFAPPVGPDNSPIMFTGEALGRQEAVVGRPFVGPSGELLNRLLKKVMLDRESVRISNLVSCQPPNDWLEGAPWEFAAVNHCRKAHFDKVLAEPHKVVVTLGGSATRGILGLSRRGHKQVDWHGSPVREPNDRFWVVPTFHPAFILRGNQKLIGTVLFDIKKAIEVATHGHNKKPTNLIVDPRPDRFAAWVDLLMASPSAWLACDIETAQKLAGQDEGELDFDADPRIIRINFAYNGTDGVTVPWTTEYLADIRRLLESPNVKCWWNARYDIPILTRAGFAPTEPNIDFMWAWHVLQSSLPRGLGFVAPFYSDYGPWKHLSAADPGTYAAIDAVQTWRLAEGISRDLVKKGQWESFWRHVYELDTKVLHPAEDVGLLVDTDRLGEFRKKLDGEKKRLTEEISRLVPDSCRVEKVWKREPDPEDNATHVVRRDSTQLCRSCGATEISKTHRCKDKSLTPEVVVGEAEVGRWVRLEPFNPQSPDQIRSYLGVKGLQGGKAKKSKTDKASTDKKTLEALAKSSKDPFFRHLLDHRAVGKVLGTYVDGSYRRLRYQEIEDGQYLRTEYSVQRLHPKFLHKPSTLRLSCVDPNLQNVVSDRDGSDSLAAGFRSALVPAEGCVLLEADFSAIEAVLTGYFARDPEYMRLARLGVHAYLTSHLIKRPASLSWPDEDLGRYFKELKGKYKADYDKAKRVVHGTNYGLGVYGLMQTYPELFPTKASAEKVQKLYFELCPKLPQWHKELRDLAHKQNYLGGDAHPFRYTHWFWQVYIYNSKAQKWGLGDDAKKCVAFMPQSSAAGVIKEACLELLDPASPWYVGEVYEGKTPVRALIHDSILLEVPRRRIDYVLSALTAVMPKPRAGLPSIGIAIKMGENWMEMKDVDLGEVGVGSDTAVKEAEDDDTEAA
jgi:uracil-DNA glycosylase family 4